MPLNVPVPVTVTLPVKLNVEAMFAPLLSVNVAQVKLPIPTSPEVTAVEVIVPYVRPPPLKDIDPLVCGSVIVLLAALNVMLVEVDISNVHDWVVVPSVRFVVPSVNDLVFELLEEKLTIVTA